MSKAVPTISPNLSPRRQKLSPGRKILSPVDQKLSPGQNASDEKLVALFDDWHASSQLTDLHDTDEDRTAYDAAYERCSEIEAEIMAASGGAVVGDIKFYFFLHYSWLMQEKGPDIALLRCPTMFDDYQRYDEPDPDQLEPGAEDVMISILRDGARRVPKIAELAAPIIHDDAILIDADIELQSYRDQSAKSPSLTRTELPERFRKLLERVAKTPANTSRGEAIKSKYATTIELLAAE